jgi:hypothetical protein
MDGATSIPLISEGIRIFVAVEAIRVAGVSRQNLNFLVWRYGKS